MKRFFAVPVVLLLYAFGVTGLIQAQEKQPGVVILKGNPLGGVKFNHTAHVKLAAEKCETCHHASKPEKPSKTAHENCQNCHTKTVATPMKTNAKLAFHDNLAKKGTCLNCHVKQAAAGKKPPLKCVDCHKKANT